MGKRRRTHHRRLHLHPRQWRRKRLDRDFRVAYFEVTDVWHIGWRGTVEVNGDEIEMYDEFTGTTDVYRWTVKGDALVLTKLRSDARLAKGIPVEVYDAAYLTDPLQRTDCPMDLGTDCPA